jgi:hypothetical protein
MIESKKEISANQMKKTLDVTYKTAWYLCDRIHKTIQEAKDKPQLTDIVEVDKTHVGGDYDPRKKRDKYAKQPVIGLLQRDGRLEAKTIPTTGKRILCGVVKDRVNKDATLMADELSVYKSLNGEYTHKTINHGKKEGPSVMFIQTVLKTHGLCLNAL